MFTKKPYWLSDYVMVEICGTYPQISRNKNLIISNVIGLKQVVHISTLLIVLINFYI